MPYIRADRAKKKQVYFLYIELNDGLETDSKRLEIILNFIILSGPTSPEHKSLGRILSHGSQV